MRTAAPTVGLAIVGLLAAAAGTTSAESRPTVPCSEAIAVVKFPYTSGGYRLVLAAISAPPAYLQQVVPSGRQTWRYWRKAGLVVTGRAAVTVAVPKQWQDRVAITWGNRPGIVSSLRIAGCPVPPHGSPSGRAYAGGFYLKSRSACVPLTFRVNERSETVRFGLGRRCR
jgi:hypothetical protein